MTVTKVKSKKQSKKNSKNGKKKTMKKNNFRKGRSMRGGGPGVWNGPNYNSGPTHFYPTGSLTSAPPNKLLAQFAAASEAAQASRAAKAAQAGQPIKLGYQGQSGQPIKTTGLQPGQTSIKLQAVEPPKALTPQTSIKVSKPRGRDPGRKGRGAYKR